MKVKELCKRSLAAFLCGAVLLVAAACSPAQEDHRKTEKTDSAGKYVSILGDSISTFEGVSNVGAVNTTIEGYNAFYNGDWQNALSGVEDTYWGYVIAKHGLELLVNNSCGGNQLIQPSGTGGAVDAGYMRVENLAADTGPLKGTKPDKIFIHIGINDFNSGAYLGELTEDTYQSVRWEDGYIIPTTFTEAYIITLEKAMELYPDAQIFVFTLLPSVYRLDDQALQQFNDRIRQLAAHYKDVVLVDIANKSGINSQNYTMYTLDGIHPNRSGMSRIATILDYAILGNP